MITARDAYRAMLRDTIAPKLRQMEFKGSGRLYRLDDDTSWARLGFQASRWNTVDEVTFTVNLAVVNKDVWRCQQQKRPRLPDVPSPGTYHGPFTWQKRIGRLMPENRDVWWDLATGHDPAPVVDEVLAAIRDYALPALREQQSIAPDSS